MEPNNLNLFSISIWGIVVLIAQSCPTRCNPTDCRKPGSSVHGIFQAKVLEWITIPFSRGTSWPRDQTWVYCIAGRFFTIWVTGKTYLGNRHGLIWCWISCLGNRSRSFCYLWGCTKILPFTLFVDYESCLISWVFLPTVVNTLVIWTKFTHSCPL